MLQDVFTRILRSIVTSISKASLAKTSGQITVAGIHNSVQILRDR